MTAKQLKRARLANGWTQKHLAEMVSNSVLQGRKPITNKAICAMEAGLYPVSLAVEIFFKNHLTR